MKKKPRAKMAEMPAIKETVVRKLEIVNDFNEKGEMITKRVYKKVNLTKLANETKKLIKTQTAEQKLAEMEKIFTK